MDWFETLPQKLTEGKCNEYLEKITTLKEWKSNIPELVLLVAQKKLNTQQKISEGINWLLVLVLQLRALPFGGA